MLIAAIVGFCFGFIGSMPVAGPIAALVFSRGIDGRFRNGLSIAAGGALAEGIYACLAFWGFAELLARYPVLVPISRAVAVVVLTALGIVFLLRKPSAKKKAPDRRSSSFGSGLALGFTITALNPTLIATWSAAATTLFSTGLVAFKSSLALPFGLSACAGIVSWFGLLLWLVKRYRHRFSDATLNRVIQAMGIFLLGVAVYFVVLLVQGLIA
jgi:threonine/homoserine/homoserine lactone efflux protein